jgi:hypothetical protein
MIHYPLSLCPSQIHIFSGTLWFEELAIYICSSREEAIFYHLTKTIDEAVSIHACIL